MFSKGKIGIIAKFHRTDLVILSHSRGTKTPSYSRINTVFILLSKTSCLFLINYNETGVGMGVRMDDLAVLHPFLIVFQSYLDDERMIMKDSMQ